LKSSWRRKSVAAERETQDLSETREAVERALEQSARGECISLEEFESENALKATRAPPLISLRDMEVRSQEPEWWRVERASAPRQAQREQNSRYDVHNGLSHTSIEFYFVCWKSINIRHGAMQQSE
jgi:hypothetical protein